SGSCAAARRAQRRGLCRVAEPHHARLGGSQSPRCDLRGYPEAEVGKRVDLLESERTSYQHRSACPWFIEYSTVVFWREPNERVYRRGRLLLGKQRGKDIFHPLPQLEALVCRHDHRLH